MKKSKKEARKKLALEMDNKWLSSVTANGDSYTVFVDVEERRVCHANGIDEKLYIREKIRAYKKGAPVNWRKFYKRIGFNWKTA